MRKDNSRRLAQNIVPKAGERPAATGAAAARSGWKQGMREHYQSLPNAKEKDKACKGGRPTWDAEEAE